MSLLLTLLGGLIGASLRCGTERYLRLRFRNPTHWVPFLLNFVGCFLFGALAGWAYLHRVTSGTILLGGLVTAFSVCSHEVGRLLARGRHGLAVLNSLTGWFIGLTAAAMGVFLSLSV
ncbi:CrcB family protein [Streptomyces sp. NRRL S-337]|uniref:CrcB family protein n=1 Tax=Streptomyces sp. NRRL S-337 TaxID=1463900 RepID=UPI00055C09A4